jgi:hypothetical protein
VKYASAIFALLLFGCSVKPTPAPHSSPPLPNMTAAAPRKALLAPLPQPVLPEVQTRMPHAALRAIPLHPRPSVILAWDASVSPEVVGYRLYDGPSSGNYTNIVDIGPNLYATRENLFRGRTYFFAVTAYDGTGTNESMFSNEVAYLVPLLTNTVTTITALIAPAIAGPWSEFTNAPAIVLTNRPDAAYFRLLITSTNF